ncbi:MAG TPA: carboxypeptidase-like regulatory domain-containing protein [Acidobacteriota bacterium]|nr:carboxypeptidase-like regulatory domain-containing protein [Acidobacteriota bacterium]HNT18072.1 carboxypeptidase-like regulatory domain-containing protein [Acidobacteriota bacterium]HQO21166.1 carboxypeptidase-like regulatory domain-containing protein [Acidobacteriota bacterium]HQQ47905.1 carboxypeptidase-like regulatory domain-containing protein [Acidobacteriota bacterium]
MTEGNKKLAAICKYDGESRFAEVDTLKNYKVVVSAAGYKTAVWDYMYLDSYSEFSMKVILQEDFDSILYQDGQCEESILAEKGQCAVTGIVTDATGTPLSRAVVALVFMTFSDSGWPTYGKVYRSVSDDYGRYEICAVPPCKRYIIQVEAQEHTTAGQTDLQLKPGKKKIMNFMLQKASEEMIIKGEGKPL